MGRGLISRQIISRQTSAGATETLLVAVDVCLVFCFFFKKKRKKKHQKMDLRMTQLLAVLIFCQRKSAENAAGNCDGELGCGFELLSGPLDCLLVVSEMASPP